MVCSGFGFGHHKFLNDFIKKEKCKKLMEIGVGNGNNAKSMVETAKKNYPINEIEYYGFDTFEDKFRFENVKEKLSKTGCNNELYKGNSEDTLPKKIEWLPKIDIIFIDGGKSYKTTLSDWKYSSKLMHEQTGVFIHNYGMYSGVKKAVNKISEKKFTINILNPPNDCTTAFIRKK